MYLSCKVICDVFRNEDQTMFLVKDNSGSNVVMRVLVPSRKAAEDDNEKAAEGAEKQLSHFELKKDD